MPQHLLPADFAFDRFLERLDRGVELKGCRVVYFDGQDLTVVREGPPVSGPESVAVIVKRSLGPETVTSAGGAKARESKLYSEILGGALGCSAAVVGWLVVASSAAAAPVTGGSSTFITVLGYGAATASSAQCFNSAVRIYNEVKDPELNDFLDSQAWYRSTTMALDGISLVGAGLGTAATVKVVLQVRRATGKSMMEVLKGLNRQERRRLAEELVRVENPGISNSALKTLVRAGVYPRRFTGLQVSQAVRLQLKEAAGAALDFTGSALGGLVSKGGDYVVGLARSIETH